MFRGTKVPGCVLVLRRIAAADMTASEAQAQVHPPLTHLDALLANMRVRASNPDSIEMRTFCCHNNPQAVG